MTVTSMEEALRQRYMRGAIGSGPMPQQPPECPTVTIRFRDEIDRALYQELLRICDDIETDIIALLHLVAGHKLRRVGK